MEGKRPEFYRRQKLERDLEGEFRVFPIFGLVTFSNSPLDKIHPLSFLNLIWSSTNPVPSILLSQSPAAQLGGVTCSALPGLALSKRSRSSSA